MAWRRKCRILLFLGFFAFAMAPPSLAQVEETEWLEIIDGVSYGEQESDEEAKKRKEEERKERERRERERREQSSGEYDPDDIDTSSSNSISLWGGGFWASRAGVIIAWTLIIIMSLVLIVLLVRIILSNSRDAKVGGSSDSLEFMMEKMEESLHETDLERALRLALESKNYKAAIRIYYLAVIKECSSRKLIKWKKDKTNHQYLMELLSTPFSRDFATVTLRYEQAWYGDQDIELGHYENLKPAFDQLLSKITKHGE